MLYTWQQMNYKWKNNLPDFNSFCEFSRLTFILLVLETVVHLLANLMVLSIEVHLYRN